jgi:hypothetical protein
MMWVVQYPLHAANSLRDTLHRNSGDYDTVDDDLFRCRVFRYGLYCRFRIEFVVLQR